VVEILLAVRGIFGDATARIRVLSGAPGFGRLHAGMRSQRFDGRFLLCPVDRIRFLDRHMFYRYCRHGTPPLTGGFGPNSTKP
jgi:hypothetical protein